MSTQFIYCGKDRSCEISVNDDDGMSWTVLSEDFFSFLQACGYVIDRADFAEYWSQYLKEEGCCGECNETTTMYDFSTNTTVPDTSTFKWGDNMNATYTVNYPNMGGTK